jgi:16S rRNA (cytosine967-C5)-methyltransferase
VLDLAAAPGGKTTHMAALMGGDGSITAIEADPKRARSLRENVDRMRVPNVEVITGDGREAPRGPYDRVLLDAPCSDLGTLQSRPDARWRKTEGQVGALAQLQRELLEAGVERLAPNGSLVYSTCTISPDENEGQVDSFVTDHPELDIVDLTTVYPGVAHPAARGYLQLLPHRDGADGFFIAKLTRRG